MPIVVQSDSGSGAPENQTPSERRWFARLSLFYKLVLGAAAFLAALGVIASPLWHYLHRSHTPSAAILAACAQPTAIMSAIDAHTPEGPVATMPPDVASATKELARSAVASGDAELATLGEQFSADLFSLAAAARASHIDNRGRPFSEDVSRYADRCAALGVSRPLDTAAQQDAHLCTRLPGLVEDYELSQSTNPPPNIEGVLRADENALRNPFVRPNLDGKLSEDLALIGPDSLLYPTGLQRAWLRCGALVCRPVPFRSLFRSSGHEVLPSRALG